MSVGCLCSCSASHKAQTTDDVYYSSGDRQETSGTDGGYVSNNGQDDRVAPSATSTADNYNAYAYGTSYSPFSTCISPYWGMGYGSMYGMGLTFGYGAFVSPFYTYAYPYAYDPFWGMGMYPTYYGGYYNPYYPGFGYYSKAYVGVGTAIPYAPRVSALAYNNTHYNNINSTLTRTGGPAFASRPITNPYVPAASRLNHGVANNHWQPYSTTSTRTGTQGTGTLNRTPNNTRTSNQPAYRPAPSMNTFSRPSGGFGGGGGARMGGGGGRGGRG